MVGLQQLIVLRGIGEIMFGDIGVLHKTTDGVDKILEGKSSL